MQEGVFGLHSPRLLHGCRCCKSCSCSCCSSSVCRECRRCPCGSTAALSGTRSRARARDMNRLRQRKQAGDLALRSNSIASSESLVALSVYLQLFGRDILRYYTKRRIKRSEVILVEARFIPRSSTRGFTLGATRLPSPELLIAYSEHLQLLRVHISRHAIQRRWQPGRQTLKGIGLGGCGRSHWRRPGRQPSRSWRRDAGRSKRRRHSPSRSSGHRRHGSRFRMVLGDLR
mmetsp:Transcript_7893/g.17416  ORF Transcript_7893/g.17416 Transcript_7893/m.17416 type:complete len:231 (-) Transcript_7893:2178-2870(-)